MDVVDVARLKEGEMNLGVSLQGRRAKVQHHHLVCADQGRAFYFSVSRRRRSWLSLTTAE